MKNLSPLRLDRRPGIAVLVLLLLTIAAWYVARASIELYDSTRFNAIVDVVRDDIELQMQTYINALVQTKGAFELKRDITRAEFAQYIRSIGLTQQYPGIQGIGYTARVRSSDLARHEQRIRQAGFPKYRVWPTTPRAEYFSIVYLEPFNWRNQRAFGYDMSTEPVRRAAMEVARDAAEPVATEKVTLVQEANDDSRQPGFLIYVPLYRAHARINTVTERQAALEGFIYSPFRANDLFLGIFEPRGESLPVDFEVFDGPDPSRESLLYDYDGELHFDDPAFEAKYQARLMLTVAGRPWTVLVYSRPSLHSIWNRYVPAAVLVGGLLLTLFASLMLRAQRQQIEASQRTTLLLESMSEGVNVSNESGIIVYTNPAADKMFGYAPGELVGQHVAILNTYPPEENRRVVNEVMQALAQNDAWFGEFKNKRKDGAAFTTFARITATDIAGGRHFVCVQEDITERKKTEESLRESEARFRVLADQAPVLIWMAGVDKSRHYLNKPWLEFTGRELEQELDHGWLNGVHPDDRSRYMQTYTAAFDARRDFSEEYRLLRHDRSYRWLLDHGTPHVTADGRFLGYIGSCIDIHERKEFERTLRDTIRARDEFLSIASHELRTPLTTLKLQAQLRKKALRAGNMAAFTQDKLEKMIDSDNRQLDRLARLVDDMLDISRITTGKLTMEIELIDLGELTREAVERLDAQFEEAGCSVHVASGPGVVGAWDRFRIEQVLMNLLTNAIKYGAGKPIDISVHRTHDRAIIEVRDGGIGIARENQERIFERFERAVSGAEISGLGLGLYIAKTIVEAHAGVIRVDSAIGAGATFIVELPLASA